jgi:hypothetical protein
LKFYLSIILFSLLFIGCNGNNSSSISTPQKDIDKSDDYQTRVAYQNKIVKLNNLKTRIELKNIDKSKELRVLQNKLLKYKRLENKLKKELIIVKKKVSATLRRVKNTKKACAIKIGISSFDVEAIIGKADHYQLRLYGIKVMSYGDVRLYINKIEQVYNIEGCKNK